MKVARILPRLVMCVVYLTVAPAWAAEPRQLPPRVVLLQLSSLTLNPSSVAGGTTPVLGTVTLNQPATTGVIVTLRSSNPTVAPVPPNVTIQPGATSATFVIQPQPVSINPNVVNPNPPSVQISAQIGNSAPMIAQLTVLPPTLAALTLNPASVGGGSGSTGTVTISSPAPAGGLVVTLSAEPTTSAPASRPGLTAKIFRNPVTVPQQVTIAAGATSASFPVTTKRVTAATTVQITAAWGVFVKKTATLTVRQAVVASFSFPPYGGSYGEVVAGNPITATVNLDGPASPEGLTVQIQSGRAAGGTTGTFAQCGQFPTVPSTVTVAGGSTSASFPITTYPGYGVYYLQTYRYANDYSMDSLVSATLYVDSPTLTSNSPILPSSVKGGSTIQGTIQLTGPAMPANCGQYALASSNTLFAQVPPHATVTPGTSQGTFNITTSAVSTAQTVTISVTGPIVNNGAATPGQHTRNAALTITP